MRISGMGVSRVAWRARCDEERGLSVSVCTVLYPGIPPGGGGFVVMTYGIHTVFTVLSYIYIYVCVCVCVFLCISVQVIESSTTRLSSQQFS
jgi:hypothetical protein